MTFIEQKILVAIVMTTAYMVYQFCVAAPEAE